MGSREGGTGALMFLNVSHLKSLVVEFEVEPAEGTSAVDSEPGLGAVAVEDVSAGESFDGLVCMVLALPTWKPSMQTVHFCLDLPIFMFLISLR